MNAGVQIGNVLIALAWGAFAAHRWPWDFRGRRRRITLKPGRRDWE